MNVMRKPALRWAAVLTLAILSWLALLPRRASAQSAGGGLTGHVLDDKKAPLPGVTISATQKETGLNRVTTTTTDGTFHLGGLPVGLYNVSAELAGFATVNVQEVKVTVSTDRAIEVTMTQSKISESITVVDEAPLIQGSPAIGTVVDQKELENLPLNGRQFANLATLAPGTQLSVNSDPTKPGQQTIALNGGSGRNVNFLVDGGDNTDDTIGGALQNFNLEAVQEFKIQTQQYKAEFGRSTGGVLSVVTKTGTNTLSGSAYGFFRDKSLNSETVTEDESGSGKQPYRREQYGASLGGPIVKDKLHFFATWEKTDRNTDYTVNTVLAAGLPPVLPAVQGLAPYLSEFFW
ncbi:MAG TPA: carboxypeptidase-like regulatory domain-containing protein [Thermoanaerobaculia bacterium]